MSKHFLVGQVLSVWIAVHVSAVAAAPPNIVVIYADDIGYGDFSCYGGTGAQTPNVDRLAAQGIRFLSAYADAATCTPARYAFLTGGHSFRNDKAEILPGNAPLIIDPDQPTIASFLRAQGYATALVGKWHLGLGGEKLDWNGEIAPGPAQLGFDYSFFMAATADRVPSVYIENNRVVNLDPADPIRVHYEEPVGDEPTGMSRPDLLRWPADPQHSGTIIGDISRIGFMTGGKAARFKDEDMLDTYVNKATSFIKGRKDGGKPFFLYFAVNENHVPRAVHDRFKGKSPLGPRGDALVAFDWGIGRLVEALKQNGLYENTLIILTSDNGPILFDGYLDGAAEINGDHKPAGPFRGGKYSLWEGGTRVPLIVSWPGVMKPAVSDALVGQVDLFASLAALLGKPVPEKAAKDGMNVLPALLGQSPAGRDFVVQSASEQLAIRKGDWKYISPGTISERGGMEEWRKTQVKEPGLLFNLAEDPGESRNLAAQHPDTLKELRALLVGVRNGPPPTPRDASTTNIQDLLAPVHVLSDVIGKQPESLKFDGAGKDSFRLSGELPNKQATVNLLPASGTWDVSAYSFFRVDFVNKGPGLVWIRGRLDNKGAVDWADSMSSQAFVMPGERATLGFAFPRAKELNDAPPIFDKQSGKPNGHREHWKAFDPSKVIACRLVIQSTSSTLALEDVVISAAYPYGAKANADLLELPYLDEFGQVRKLDWPGKLHSEEELMRRDENERAAWGGDHGPRSFNSYGGWADGPKFKATGFFRVQKVNGKWWLIDPDGRLFFSHGANSIGFEQTTPIPSRKELFAWLPDAEDPRMHGVIRNNQMQFMAANLARTFGPSWRKPAHDRVHTRLRHWGMNTLGAWSDGELMAEKRTPFTPILHVGGKWSPLGNKIADPFAKNFKANLIQGLRRIMPDPENPWCVGVFIDNEIDWTEHFVHNAFLRGVDQPARIACIGWLKNKYGTIQKLNKAWGTSYGAWKEIAALPEKETKGLTTDISELKRLIAGTYYRTCREAVREAMPNHLYLGSRQHKADPEVYEESAKYVDVLSLNSYEPLSGSKIPRGLDAPCMDTEFHFGAPDRGVPGVGLWSVGDQLQRSRAYVAYVMSGIKHPQIVGAHWFAFPDQSAAGRPGENYQIGFVDVTDTPYPEITRASRIMAEQMYQIGTDDSKSLLESLEALWRNGDVAPGSKRISYRIEKSEGMTVSTGDEFHAVTGNGPFSLVLKPAEGDTWNMDHVRVLGVMLRNAGQTDLVLDILVRNEGATSWSDSALGRTVIKAGETLPLGAAFQRLADYREKHPAFLHMSGRPNGFFRHWRTFDPAHVKDLLITCATPGEHAFELGPMFPLQETDKRLTDKLPIIDRYGQYIHRNWPGKAFSDADIKATAQVEEALIREIGPAHDLNPYGGWKSGPQLQATGFFRTEKVDGKWWFVDPEGRLFWSFGVNCVGADFAGQTPTERNLAVFQSLPAVDDPVFGRFHVKLDMEENFLQRLDVPHYDFTRANLFRKYGEGYAEKQVGQDIQRLIYTHINTIGAWSDVAVAARRQVPYVAMLHYVYPEAAPKLPDPFHPETRLSLRKELKAYPVPFANDPWCLGAFVDNELHWKNDARHLIAAIFGHTTTGSEARKVFIGWLQEKYDDVAAFNAAWKTKFKAWDDLLSTTDPAVFSGADAADCRALATLFADALFGMVRQELTAYSPKVLYLGCRMNSGPPEVIAALARHADVISANIYSYRPQPGQYGAIDKPLLISEFHFANVSGNNLGGGLRSAQDAVQQGRLLKEYMAEAVRHPQIVGAHWFQWRDHNAAGRHDGENFDVGLYDIVDGPNVELVRAMAACGRSLYPNTR